MSRSSPVATRRHLRHLGTGDIKSNGAGRPMAERPIKASWTDVDALDTVTAVCTTPSSTVRVCSSTKATVTIRASSTATTSIPADEQWLWRNSTSLTMVMRGIADVKHCRVVSLGSFAKFATEDDEENE